MSSADALQHTITAKCTAYSKLVARLTHEIDPCTDHWTGPCTDCCIIQITAGHFSRTFVICTYKFQVSTGLRLQALNDLYTSSSQNYLAELKCPGTKSASLRSGAFRGVAAVCPRNKVSLLRSAFGLPFRCSFMVVRASRSFPSSSR